jgi:threonine/homoserine/homoserine lactone efflux protein
MASFSDWFAMSGLIFAAAITPGPNNALVLRAGLAKDWRAVTTIVVGVQLGAVALLALCWSGVSALVQAYPLFSPALVLLGSAYLVWLGLTLISSSGAQTTDGAPQFGATAVIALQFANPKAWILFVTLGSATAGSLIAVGKTAALFIGISIACLLLWSAAGAQLSHILSSDRGRRIFDQGMGLLLIISAIGLVASNLSKGVPHAAT